MLYACLSTALLAAAIPELGSEADCVAVITSVWPEPGRSLETQAILFEALSILWRFGSRLFGEVAVREGHRMLGSAYQDHGRLHVRLAQLMEADDGP